MQGKLRLAKGELGCAKLESVVEWMQELRIGSLCCETDPAPRQAGEGAEGNLSEATHAG